MPKFKPQDVIEAKEKGRGFEKAKVLKTYISKSKKFKGREMYLLKIMCGITTVPVEMEVNYRLCKEKK